MSHVTYRIVQHDGGWAYTVDGSYSETFPSHDVALKAARRAAGEQRVSGDTAWHRLRRRRAAVGTKNCPTAEDRPDTDVEG